VAVRRVHDDDVDAGRDQRLATRSSVSPPVPTAAATLQRAALVLAGAREVGGLLEVLGRDHALEAEILVDDQHLLDAVLVQQLQHLFLGRRPRAP
jgi:hypothetical protein